MRLTNLFTKTSKNVPGDEVAKNAQLLIQAGFIHKEMAGVYSYLPLGRIVLDKIVDIIRDEMDKVGGNEVSLTALQPKDVWQQSGRWDDSVIDVWFKTKLANGQEAGLAPTHEEPLTQMMRNFVQSYKDLPVYPYQFQIKFRNELRSKSGLMRGREFWMKDLYSFSADQQQHDEFYEKITESYHNVYKRLGIGDITYRTFASGGSFAKFSHEFQTISPVGEDKIYIDKSKNIAINEEVLTDEVLQELNIKREDLVEEKAVEVGNVFTLGTRFSEPLGLNYTDEQGALNPVFMGSYGIGPSRLMGLLAEHFADEKGLVWPESVAPAKVYLASMGAEVSEAADKLYEQLLQAEIEVIFDDRDVRPGQKFADSELMGIPYRITVGKSSVEQERYELTTRTDGATELLTVSELLAKLS